MSIEQFPQQGEEWRSETGQYVTIDEVEDERVFYSKTHADVREYRSLPVQIFIGYFERV